MPLSQYQLFVKEHMKSVTIKALPQRQRFKAIAELWKSQGHKKMPLAQQLSECKALSKSLSEKYSASVSLNEDLEKEIEELESYVKKLKSRPCSPGKKVVKSLGVGSGRVKGVSANVGSGRVKGVSAGVGPISKRRLRRFTRSLSVKRTQKSHKSRLSLRSRSGRTSTPAVVAHLLQKGQMDRLETAMKDDIQNVNVRIAELQKARSNKLVSLDRQIAEKREKIRKLQSQRSHKSKTSSLKRARESLEKHRNRLVLMDKDIDELRRKVKSISVKSPGRILKTPSLSESVKRRLIQEARNELEVFEKKIAEAKAKAELMKAKLKTPSPVPMRSPYRKQKAEDLFAEKKESSRAKKERLNRDSIERRKRKESLQRKFMAEYPKKLDKEPPGEARSIKASKKVSPLTRQSVKVQAGQLSTFEPNYKFNLEEKILPGLTIVPENEKKKVSA